MAIGKLAEKIQHERKRNGLSQEALALRLGLRRQSVSRWESGEGYPELETVLEISRCFGVSTDYLLNDELPVGYQTSPEMESVDTVPSTQAVPATRRLAFSGIIGVLLGVFGIVSLWVLSILDPAPVMGPELGFFRAYWHYLGYHGRAPLFWASTLALIMGCALILWDAVRRRTGGRKQAQFSLEREEEKPEEEEV